jgi:hypothetical protein
VAVWRTWDGGTVGRMCGGCGGWLVERMGRMCGGMYMGRGTVGRWRDVVDVADVVGRFDGGGMCGGCGGAVGRWRDVVGRLDGGGMCGGCGGAVGRWRDVVDVADVVGRLDGGGMCGGCGGVVGGADVWRNAYGSRDGGTVAGCGGCGGRCLLTVGRLVFCVLLVFFCSGA